MNFAELQAALAARLDEADRGDRAWWLLTRVHLSAARLQQIALYLHDAGAAVGLNLTAAHYANLALTLEIDTANPAVVINRHYFLAMDKPLQLLERADGVHWNNITLTPAGVALATTADASSVLEAQLNTIRFCRVPWYNQQRVDEYLTFDVRPYPAVLAVMHACGGYIDVDEFDLFVSRIRSDAEIAAAVDGVQSFRPLTDAQKQALRGLVAARVPAGGGSNPHKPYQNWRDMARHTFALFSLGSRAIQVDNRLYRAAMLAEATTPAPAAAAAIPQAAPAVPPPAAAPVAPPPPPAATLRIPEAEAPPELLTPPGAPQVNNGAESELLIGKIFAAAGWQVVYYNQRRGYGFDLWVRKEDQAFVVEVKSFVGQGASVTLTSIEHEAAQHHGDNYLLVIVEQAITANPELHVIQNPFGVLQFNPSQIAQYSVGRATWLPVAEALEP